MTKYIGRLIKVGVGRETVRGNGAIPVYLIPFAKLTFDDHITNVRSVGALGVLADSEERFTITKYGQGELETEIRSKSIGFLLYAMLGGYSVVGPVDSAYTHSYSITQNNQHQSLSFVVSDPNAPKLYKLVMLDSLKLAATIDKLLTLNATFISKTARDTGLTQPALVAESKFTKKHINIKFADTIAGLSSAPKVYLKLLNFNVMKNIAMDDFLGTADIVDVLNHQISVEGDFELNYEDQTYKNYQMNATYKCMEIDCINIDALIGAATRPSLIIQMPKVDFYDWTPTYDLDKIVTQKVAFHGNYDLANNLDVISSCKLVNDVASY